MMSRETKRRKSSLEKENRAIKMGMENAVRVKERMQKVSDSRRDRKSNQN